MRPGLAMEPSAVGSSLRSTEGDATGSLAAVPPDGEHGEEVGGMTVRLTTFSHGAG